MSSKVHGRSPRHPASGRGGTRGPGRTQTHAGPCGGLAATGEMDRCPSPASRRDRLCMTVPWWRRGRLSTLPHPAVSTTAPATEGATLAGPDSGWSGIGSRLPRADPLRPGFEVLVARLRRATGPLPRPHRFARRSHLRWHRQYGRRELLAHQIGPSSRAVLASRMPALSASSRRLSPASTTLPIAEARAERRRSRPRASGTPETAPPQGMSRILRSKPNQGSWKPATSEATYPAALLTRPAAVHHWRARRGR